MLARIAPLFSLSAKSSAYSLVNLPVILTDPPVISDSQLAILTILLSETIAIGVCS
jgi:hypothetical protein